MNTPVRVPLAVPASLAMATAATVETPDGKLLVAQVTAPALLASEKPAGDGTPRELHFILPELKAGASVTLKATVRGDAPQAGESFAWKDTPGESAELRLGARPVLRYMYKAIDESSAPAREQTYKVFHHLFDPDGTRLVTKGPGGLYTHHRGLYFGFNRITYGDGKKADCWHCTDGAHQAHEKILATEAGPVLGRHRLAIVWYGKSKQAIAREERELTVYRVPGGRLVEFASRLRAADGKVKLDGDPQHAGFHFRADQEVAATTKGQTYFLRPDGQDKPGATRNWSPKTPKVGTDLPWNAMSFVLGEQRYTAGYLDRPGNPKEARYSERDYGRFGSYFEYEITADKPLELNYQLWLQKGETTGPEMARRDADFIAPVGVTVK